MLFFNKIKAQNIFVWYSSQMLKIQATIFKKCYEIVWKLQNRRCFMLEITSSFIFLLITESQR